MRSLGSDHSKEVVLWEVVGGRDNGLSSRPSLLSSHMYHVAGAFEIQYNTIPSIRSEVLNFLLLFGSVSEM